MSKINPYNPNTTCIPVKNIGSCLPWTLQDLYIDKEAIADVYDMPQNAVTAETWEWGVIGASSANSTSSQLLKWWDWIQCTGYKGEYIRYLKSYTCYTDLFVISAGCNNDIPIQSVPPLCQDSCSIMGTAISDIVKSPTLCTTTQNEKALENRQKALKATENCNAVGQLSHFQGQNQCIEGVGLKNWASDLTTCGFGNVDQAKKFCSLKENLELKCCEQFKKIFNPFLRNMIFIVSGGLLLFYGLLAILCC
ncbi:hypothetical protein BC833DRAFT_587783 [Globomyces pollinis-pini]|nr:hypothetical protein BC833DRAFT_587783 [Globomyces pollinis-pini]KAJ2996199.1 hypothetical protein HDV02_006727 [Globomyces sp. JEL0801]